MTLPTPRERPAARPFDFVGMTPARLDNVRKLLEAEQAYLDGLHAQALSRRLLYVSDESLSWAQLDVAAALVECSAEQIRRAYPR